MKPFESKHLIALLGVLVLAFSGCASDGSKPQAQQTAQQIEAPQTVALESDKKLFSQALKAQNEGQYESAIKLWESFLSKYPDSFEGHNNLGLVYYTQDMLSQALQQFEIAYRLEPVDERIRENLARALRFKASMLHENRDYFKTLEILARLEQIVEPEEKQAILFKQEQVEDQIFLQVIKANNSAAYRDFINRFPDGLNAVRAHEYLDQHPYRVSKSTSQVKSWISSGKAVKNPSGDSGDSISWASSEKPPQYGSSRPTATYTPPPAGTKKKKDGDFFGTDSAAVEDITEENVTTFQEIDPVAAIPFEDFEKPERSSGEQAAAKEPADGKESRAVAGEFNSNRGEPDEMAAGLDTLPDLKPSQVVALPVEMDAPQLADTSAGDIKMQQAEQEQAEAVTASAENTVEQANEEEAKQEEPEAEVTQAESVQPEQTQPEPASEMQAEKESPQEEPPMEVATFDPEDQDATQEMAPAESAPVEEIPSSTDLEEKQKISQETISETVAALIPSLPPATAIETPTESMDSSNTMVVIQMREGSTLNVRAKPSTQGDILGYLKNGDTMPFMSESGDWYQIEIEDGLSGWVSKKYSNTQNVTSSASLPAPEEELISEESPLQPDQQQSSGAMVVVTVHEDSTLNVRSIPSSSGAVVDMLFGGDTLPLVKEEGEWYQVQFEDETTGWISKKFSVLEGGATEASPEGGTAEASLPVPKEKKTDYWKTPVKKASKEMVTTVVVIKVREGSSLKVRSAPSSQGKVMGSLKSGDMRPLLEETGEWYQVELQDGQSGWVSRKFSGKMDLGSSFLQNP